MSHSLNESMPAMVHYHPVPESAVEHDARQYHHLAIANDLTNPVDSTLYLGSPHHVDFQRQTAYQALPSEGWPLAEPADSDHFNHHPHAEPYLPHYAQLWRQLEPEQDIPAPVHGYATLHRQPLQTPYATATVDRGHHHPRDSNAASVTRVSTQTAGATTTLPQQSAKTSRSRRTTRATYPHNSPGPPKASPVQRFTDASGKEFMRFEYTMNRKKTQVELRCDIDHIDIANLSAAFKRDNACYKEAGDGNIDEVTIRIRMYDKGKTDSEVRTRLKRMKYEVDCNRIGWRLAALNGDKLAGKKGMIQRAADSYRNSGSDLNQHSRRMNREIIKARRRAADDEASRDAVAPTKTEPMSASPINLAAQSPADEAFPAHPFYGSGFGFGPVNNASTSYQPQYSPSSSDLDSGSLSSATATIPPTPHSSAQVLTAPHVRLQPHREPIPYPMLHEALNDPQLCWQRCDIDDVSMYAFPTMEQSSDHVQEQWQLRTSFDPVYQYQPQD